VQDIGRFVMLRELVVVVCVSVAAAPVAAAQ
jgi:hypothetical protein